jgi:20S proteasome alpha/beta subunit
MAGIDVLRHLRRAQSWAQVTARARAAALDVGEWELLGYDSTREMLLTLDSSCEISVAHMYAIGSGAPFAFGALYVLGAPKTLEDAAKHCRKALCAATARSVHCGGKLRIVTYRKSV